MADRRYSVPVGDKLVYYGTWDHDPSKYANFRVMFETAREQLTEFEARAQDRVGRVEGCRSRWPLSEAETGLAGLRQTAGELSVGSF